jgi:hypothetical protein
MSDRRRSPRYVLSNPLSADAMSMQDVTVESFSPARLVVTSQHAHAINEELTVHLATASGLESHRTRVVSRSPVSVGGALCYRLELQPDDDLSGAGVSSGEPAH